MGLAQLIVKFERAIDPLAGDLQGLIHVHVAETEALPGAERQTDPGEREIRIQFSGPSEFHQCAISAF